MRAASLTILRLLGGVTLSGALVLAALQLESETRPPPPPRRQIHRTEGGWSCSTIWNYVLKGDDSTYLANFCCTRRQFDDLVGQLEAGAPYVVSRLGGRGNPTLFRGPRSHGRGCSRKRKRRKPTVGRNGALTRFGLAVGRVEFWISTRRFFS